MWQMAARRQFLASLRHPRRGGGGRSPRLLAMVGSPHRPKRLPHSHPRELSAPFEL
jgi:hypothetical protein